MRKRLLIALPLLWLRLPMQGVFIAWVYFAAIGRRKHGSHTAFGRRFR